MGRPQPSSDGNNNNDDDFGVRPRATQQIPHIFKKSSRNGAIGINNVGNAFTPQGGCDPLVLTTLGVGLHHAGPLPRMPSFYIHASPRTLRMPLAQHLCIRRRMSAHRRLDLIIYGEGTEGAYDPRSVADLVYDPTSSRTVIHNGRITASNVPVDVPR